MRLGMLKAETRVGLDTYANICRRRAGGTILGKEKMEGFSQSDLHTRRHWQLALKG